MRDRELLMIIVRRAHRIGHRVELSSNGWLNLIDSNGRTVGKDLDPLEAQYHLDLLAEKLDREPLWIGPPVAPAGSHCMQIALAEGIQLDRLLALAWRAARVDAVIDSKAEPDPRQPEEKRGRFRLARWVHADLSVGVGAGFSEYGVSLDELERQIRELERERYEAYEGGAAA